GLRRRRRGLHRRPPRPPFRRPGHDTHRHEERTRLVEHERVRLPPVHTGGHEGPRRDPPGAAREVRHLSRPCHMPHALGGGEAVHVEGDGRQDRAGQRTRGEGRPDAGRAGTALPPELVERLEEQRRRVMARESGGDGRRSGGDGGAEGLMRSTTYLRGSDGTSTVNTKGLEGKLARAGGLEERREDPWWRSFLGTSVSTALSEKLEPPKAIAIFYGEIAKSCYIATGSKRVACVVAAGACTIALIPGAHQGPFIIACAGSLRMPEVHLRLLKCTSAHANNIGQTDKIVKKIEFLVGGGGGSGGGGGTAIEEVGREETGRAHLDAALVLGSRVAEHDRALVVPYDPRVRQRLVHRHPPRRVGLEEPPHEVPRLGGRVLPVVARESVPPPGDGAVRVRVVLPVEGRVAGQEDVGDDTYGPQIAAPVVPLLQHLGGDVVRSPDDGRHGSLAATVVPPRESEVDELDGRAVLGVEEDVLRLQVAVDYVPVVQVLDGLEDLEEYPGRLDLVEATRTALVGGPLDDLVEELAALAELGDDVNVLCVLEGVPQADDAAVPHLVEQRDLAPESRRLDGALALLDRLDGVPLAGPPVLALPDRAVVARAEHPGVDVVAVFYVGVAAGDRVAVGRLVRVLKSGAFVRRAGRDGRREGRAGSVRRGVAGLHA
ncbi:hypothetical protein THAOC_27117, partial [Thalassiosira oceanica]